MKLFMKRKMFIRNWKIKKVSTEIVILLEGIKVGVGLGAIGKTVLCGLEVTGSSCENSLLHKKV